MIGGHYRNFHHMNFERETKKALAAARERRRLETVGEGGYEQDTYFTCSQVSKDTCENRHFYAVQVISTPIKEEAKICSKKPLRWKAHVDVATWSPPRGGHPLNHSNDEPLFLLRRPPHRSFKIVKAGIHSGLGVSGQAHLETFSRRFECVGQLHTRKNEWVRISI